MEKLRSPETEEKILSAIKKQLSPAYQLKFARGGHDITHFQRMLKIADIIVDPEEVNPFLLKIAIWYHDLDRTTYFGLSDEEERIRFMQESFSNLGLLENEIELIIDAVLKHMKLNEESDSPLLVCLKDVDHLDMGAIGILRTGAHHRIPPYNLLDFQGKPPADADEKLESHVEDIKFCLGWEDMLRTPGAKILGKKRFSFMRRFLKEVERELKELGMI